MANTQSIAWLGLLCGMPVAAAIKIRSGGVDAMTFRSALLLFSRRAPCQWLVNSLLRVDEAKAVENGITSADTVDHYAFERAALIRRPFEGDTAVDYSPLGDEHATTEQIG